LSANRLNMPPLPSKRAFVITTLLAVGFALMLALVFPSCYRPAPQSGGFRCTFEEDYSCPTGLRCDQSLGLCVKTIVVDDMGPQPRGLDLGPEVVVPTCDDHVRKGGFSNLTNLGAVNTAGEETGLTVTADKSRLYFVDVTGALRTSTLTSRKAAAASAVVTLTPTQNAIGSPVAVGADVWFPALLGTDTALFRATGSGTTFTVSPAHQPIAPCPFEAPFFVDGDVTKDLYLGFPLGGCSKKALISVGSADKEIGAFYAALPDRDLHNPTLTPGGLTLIFSSQNRLWYSDRPDTSTQFRSPFPLPLSSLGAASTREISAQISPDCTTLYLVLDRAGGQGGADFWAADIN